MHRSWARAVGALAGLVAVCGVALAHGGSLRTASTQELAVPTWLFLATGGAVVGASFLLASFVTDRAFVESVHDRTRTLPAPRSVLAWTGRLAGVAGLALVVWMGFFGPNARVTELQNVAILLVWVGWWAGFTMSVYVVGNSWPAVDPFRTLTRPLALLTTGERDVSADRAAWASALLLLALVWVEVVSPLADEPRLLATTALGYLAMTAVGVFAVGHRTWFTAVDPLARLFRMYGSVAPVQRTEDGLRLRIPGARLTDKVVATDGGVGFVVALLWGTTYDGLVGTPAWAAFARAVVETRVELPALYAGAPTPTVYPGVPPALLYPVALLVGFAVFYWLFRRAAALARRTGPTYTDAATLARRFAPSLLAIAAGYHLAHYLVYFLSLSPALLGALLSPVNPPVARTLVLPAWLSGVGIVAVLLGHLLAIWAAHGVAFDELPGRLQAVRSQYPLTVVMVFYTMLSLWIVGQPTTSPPYL
ncbi:hypothetical protein [Halobacterium zhouii]|uniref:hypothetical protein n=1 Tax=Halobacterium zhouii TaxID=2902624 RepID=UPI001E5E4A21|nr:hypothetical protein [Halobacterium zhouii]